ncbi:MAG TPA: hypothetical protein VG452_12460 [Egibacteraceae bacterium]|nr:hypothetical protein [Egibacteraceae bacterium]
MTRPPQRGGAVYEPYVADPVETPSPPRYTRLRALAALLLLVVLLADLGYLLWHAQATEDPALEAPAGQP